MKIKIYKCFISSPSDVLDERNACEEILNEVSESLGNVLNFRIEPVRWEKDLVPSFLADDAQDLTNKTILKDCDMFIGMMWSRFGTPTKREEGGTYEEFKIAYDRFKKNEIISPMLYFKTNNIEYSADPEQFASVKKFKKEITSSGGAYSEFSSLDEFKSNLKSHLFKLLGELNHGGVNTLDANRYSKILEIFEKKFEDSLISFADQPAVWLEPILSEKSQLSRNPTDDYDKRISPSTIIEDDKSYIIKSPPQFGLTCLGHYLVKESWKINKGWLFVDSKNISRNAVEKGIDKALNETGLTIDEVECIIVDSWIAEGHGYLKLLRNLNEAYQDKKFVVLQTMDPSFFLSKESSSSEESKIKRPYKALYLLPLPQNQVRKAVVLYNKKRNIGDEDIVLQKVVNDLNVLNIHRTPLNCFTLLKVLERNFDESPVNRTKMLSMVLFILFDFGELPTYKSKPDVQDCEHVLGYFCELLMRENNYTFSQEYFKKSVDDFCDKKLIYLDTSIVFDTLYNNNIIISDTLKFKFRNSYWVYYFAAKRMHINSKFAQFMLQNSRYAAHPELIEFYTGIDRARGDAIQILLEDLTKTCDSIDDKLGLPVNMNPYDEIKFNATKENLVAIQNDISDDVLNSKLPDEVKDRYADKNYDQLKPYNQNIRNFFNEYSLIALRQKIKAASRALRNSNYVEDPQLKKKLLSQINRGSVQYLKVLFVLAPALAANNSVFFEGIRFILEENIQGTFQEKIDKIVPILPYHVVSTFKDDLFSDKLGPLLYESLHAKESSNIEKHNTALLIALTMPTAWMKNLEKHIISQSYNSFYLRDLLSVLQFSYRTSFASNKQLNEAKRLINFLAAKHLEKKSKPSNRAINKVVNAIPKRNID